jgi:hypothetical protein
MAQPFQAADAIFRTSVAAAEGASYLAQSASNAYKTKSFSSIAKRIFGGSDVRFEPLNSDLAYLLYDNDDNDENGTPGVKYIVENLEDYGTRCIPLKVFVSALLRTWETAFLLYLHFLYNKEQPDYSQTLVLEVSPFLLEGKDTGIQKKVTAGKKLKEVASAPIPTFTMNSNKPLDFKGNVEQFISFIKLFIYLKKQKTILSQASNALGNIPKNFTIIIVAGNDKVYLRINITDTDVEQVTYSYTSSSSSGGINISSAPIKIPDLVLKDINSRIIQKIKPPNNADKNNKYESYSDDRLTKKTGDPAVELPPPTIYTTFPMPDISYFDSFEKIAKFTPDIFSFLKWVIEVKSHPKNVPILFVSHSGSLREFLVLMITSLNYNYSDITDATPKSLSVFAPSDKFKDVCGKVKATNTWSTRFKYLGYNVTASRHAQSCDNMYKILSTSRPTYEKVLTIRGVELKDYIYREKYGNYTNLSLWGIFSTLIFVNTNKEQISKFNETNKLAESGFMVISGMAQQTTQQINDFGLDNELTCGDISRRFSVSSSAPGKSIQFNFIKDTFVDIIPYNSSLQSMSILNRQRMSSTLSSLSSVFSTSFVESTSEGIKISVEYIGDFSFYDNIISSFEGASLEEVVQNVKRRKIFISIKRDNSNYILNIDFVNPGGLILDKIRNRKFETSRFSPFTNDIKPVSRTLDSGTLNTDSLEKEKISNAFQRCVSFLLGFEIVTAGSLNYDTMYNISIVYANLLIRDLQTIYLLQNASKNKDDVFNDKLINVNTFTAKAVNLYGGKNNEDNNEDTNQDNNEDNNKKKIEKPSKKGKKKQNKKNK